MFLEFIEQNILMFAVLIAVSTMLIYSYYGDKIGGYKSISPGEATRLYNQGAYVIDVRTANEYKTGRIADAVNIPLLQFNSKIKSLMPYQNKPVIVYCHSGGRASKVASLLVKEGFDNVCNISGGIIAWQADDLPINKIKKSKNTKKLKKNKNGDSK